MVGETEKKKTHHWCCGARASNFAIWAIVAVSESFLVWCKRLGEIIGFWSEGLI